MRIFAIASICFLFFHTAILAAPSPDDVSELILSCKIEEIRRGTEKIVQEEWLNFDEPTISAFWNRTDFLGLTPLHWAIILYPNLDDPLEVFKLLFKLGANPNSRFPTFDSGLLPHILLREKEARVFTKLESS